VNIKEYILSGVVESYVLGLASGEERMEFEQLCTRYPELVEARTNFELLLEKQAMKCAEPPAIENKNKIWSAIEQPSSSNASKTITMEPTTRRSKGIRWVAAASVILMLAAGYFAYDFYSKNEKLESATRQMQTTLDSTNKQMDELKKMMEVMTNPNITVVSMVGTQKSPSSANIYWDTASADVYMAIKNIPKLPGEKQYQLWAFIDQKPVDLGLFDADKPNLFLKMKNTRKAEAFAITIEKRGNGPTPQGTMETYGRKL
jgi:anti-sigma-K factor RskA